MKRIVSDEENNEPQNHRFELYNKEIVWSFKLSQSYLNFSWGHPHKMFRFPSPNRPISLEKLKKI